jgi:2-methylcitrate dehydratase PrpD
MKRHALAPDDVERLRIRTFHYATRLAGHDPKTPDEIAYSIVFPVAAAIVRGKFGLEELQRSALDDPAIRRLCANTELIESAHLTEISVKKRWADVTLFLKDGRELECPPKSARGDPDDPLSDEELDRKYRLFAEPVLGSKRAEEIRDLGHQFDSLSAKDLERLCTLVVTSIQVRPEIIASGRAGAL